MISNLQADGIPVDIIWLQEVKLNIDSLSRNSKEIADAMNQQYDVFFELSDKKGHSGTGFLTKKTLNAKQL